MATTYTPNYHLGKQTDPNDNFDMSVITANMDTIDAQMKTNADNVALAQQGIDDLNPVLTQILNTVGDIQQSTSTINTNVIDINNKIGDTAETLDLILSGFKGASSKVNFYDYDGSIVESYDKDEFLALTEMPSNPSHEGLTAQGWNYNLTDAKTYVTTYGSLDIGQMYTTDDGSTRLHIRLGDGRLKPFLGLTGDSSGTAVSIDWGDGSTVESVTLNTSTIYTPHEYSTSGDYTISISVTTGSITLAGANPYWSNILRTSSNPNGNNDKVYQNSLISIEIGTNVSIGQGAFYSCYSLSSITILDGVTSIGGSAFYGCSSLTSITIPDSVTSIGGYAFYGCSSLTSITIPNTVTSIGNNAFYQCYSLQSITIPDTGINIGQYAFNACYSLQSITVPNTVTSIGQYAFSGCQSLTSITIPDGVKSIGDNVFYNCYALQSITIPDSVTTIGGYAFYNCYSLQSITIPDTVINIGQYAFANCYTLTSITIPDSVTSIGDRVFSGCYSLTSITIPDSVTSIGTYAFAYCYSLSSVTIPDTVTIIGSYAFQYCYSLQSITIPDTVTTIGGYAFYNCYGLGFIKFESSTPPTVSSSTVWGGVATDCKIYVPTGTIETYKAATNYPNPSTYTYIEY